MPLSREEKEQLYIRKMTKLQRQWKNPIQRADFDDVPHMTDEELDRGIENIVGQLRFEIGYVIFTIVVVVALVMGFNWLFS